MPRSLRISLVALAVALVVLIAGVGPLLAPSGAAGSRVDSIAGTSLGFAGPSGRPHASTAVPSVSDGHAGRAIGVLAVAAVSVLSDSSRPALSLRSCRLRI